MPDKPATRPDLPTFARPPVAEMVLGVNFGSIPGWNVTHYGLLFEAVRDRYPNVQAQPPLPSPVEKFESPQAQQFAIELNTSGAMDTRCWFIDSTDARLLQVQANRFIRNWRKRPQHTDYPRYDVHRREFSDEWNHYLSFLEAQHLPRPAVSQCEVTYINHIEHAATDLHEVFSAWNDVRRGTSFLPSVETGSFTLAYVLPDRRGRLHVELQPVLRVTDGAQLLQLTLTARGRPGSPSLQDILAWFDLGHEWVVRGFTELTTEKMHRIWGRNS